MLLSAKLLLGVLHAALVKICKELPSDFIRRDSFCLFANFWEEILWFELLHGIVAQLFYYKGQFLSFYKFLGGTFMV